MKAHIEINPKHIGGTLVDFLREEGVLEEVDRHAAKKLLGAELFEELVSSVRQGGEILRASPSRRALRNWEHGKESPDGPARVLLQVVLRHPDAVWDIVCPK